MFKDIAKLFFHYGINSKFAIILHLIIYNTIRYHLVMNSFGSIFLYSFE